MVGAPTVREFYGALIADRRAAKGILITTSGFTEQALAFAKGLPIDLVAFEELKSLLARYGLDRDSELAQAVIGYVKHFRETARLNLEVTWPGDKAVILLDGKELSPRLNTEVMLLWLDGFGKGWTARLDVLTKGLHKLGLWTQRLSKIRVLFRRLTMADAESALGPPKSKKEEGEDVFYNYQDIILIFRGGKLANIDSPQS
jgi:hypothetical protein